MSGIEASDRASEEGSTMRVRFLANHNYTPSADHRVTIAYKAGMEETVRRECGDAAVAAGDAVEIDAPPAPPPASPAKPSPTAPAARDPLDHDGDGRKGGSKGRRARGRV